MTLTEWLAVAVAVAVVLYGLVLLLRIKTGH